MSNRFETHNVNNLSEAANFGDWVSEQVATGKPVAIAPRPQSDKVAIATTDDAWVIDLAAASGPIAIGVLRQQIITHEALKILLRESAGDLIALSKQLGKVLGVDPPSMFDYLAPSVVGDLSVAAHCINQPVTPASKFRNPAGDAFEIALLEPQFSYNAPKYYRAVGMPFSRTMAASRLHVSKKDLESPAWWVSYPDLWLRVLAYYTGDPTISSLLAEGDPYPQLARMLEVTEDEVYPLMLWQACGRDMAVFTQRFPSIQLPQGAWESTFDRHLPVLSAGAADMKTAYWQSRTVNTLYGRTLRAGHSLGEAVAYRIFGSVEEIVAVAAVTFMNGRQNESTFITGIDGGPAAPLIRIKGSGRRGDYLWMKMLQDLAPLMNPLSLMPLNPTVVIP